MTLAFVVVPKIYMKIFKKNGNNATFGLTDAAFGVVANLTNRQGTYQSLL